MIVVDIQGVGDVYTDPQIHSNIPESEPPIWGQVSPSNLHSPAPNASAPSVSAKPLLRDVLERRYTVGGGGVPPLPPPTSLPLDPLPPSLLPF